MQIQLAKASDLAEIFIMVQRCINKMQRDGIDQWDEIYPGVEIFQKDIENKELFICRVQDLICGCIVLNEYQEPAYQDIDWAFRPAKVCVVHRLLVDPEYQGHGIAQALMEYVENYAKEHKYRAMRLDTFIENPRAIKFYERLAYQRSGMVTFRKGQFICFEKEIS